MAMFPLCSLGHGRCGFVSCHHSSCRWSSCAAITAGRTFLSPWVESDSDLFSVFRVSIQTALQSQRSTRLPRHVFLFVLLCIIFDKLSDYLKNQSLLCMKFTSLRCKVFLYLKWTCLCGQHFFVFIFSFFLFIYLFLYLFIYLCHIWIRTSEHQSLNVMDGHNKLEPYNHVWQQSQISNSNMKGACQRGKSHRLLYTTTNINMVIKWWHWYSLFKWYTVCWVGMHIERKKQNKPKLPLGNPSF